MPEEPIFGELNESGAIVKNTRVSALSGHFTEPGDPMIHIAGTNVFYRLESQEFRKMNDERYAAEAVEMRKAIESKPGYPANVAPITPASTEVVSADEPFTSRRKAKE